MRGVGLKLRLMVVVAVCAAFALSCGVKAYVPQGTTFFEQRVVPRPPDKVYDAALKTFLKMGAPISYKNEREKMISTGYVYSEDFYWRNKYSLTVEPHPQGSVIRCVIQAWQNVSKDVVEKRYSPTLPLWTDYNYFYALTYLELKPAIIGIHAVNSSVEGPPLKVVKVDPNSPADIVGVKEEDIIVEVDSKPLTYSFEFWEIMLSKKVGDTTKLKIKRNKEIIELEMPVLALPDE